MVQLDARMFFQAICVGVVFLIPAPSALSTTVGSWLFTAGFFGLWLFAVSLDSPPDWNQKSKVRNRVEFDSYVTILALGWMLASVASSFMALFQVQENTAWALGWISSSPERHAYANFRQRNHLATLLAIGLSAALYFSIKTSLHRRSSYLGALSVGSAILLMTLAQALTASRTGALQWVAVLSFAGLVIFHSGKKHLLWVISLAGVGFILCVAGVAWYAETPSDAGIIGRLNDDNAMSRLALWRNVLELIAQKPWLGHGWYSLAYAHYSTEFSGARFMEMLDNAHNLPLHLAVELGVPVAVLFCGTVGWLIWKNKPWAETRADRQLAWGILMVIGIHSWVEYPLWYGPFFMTTLICIGILCGDLWRNWLSSVTKSTQYAINLGIQGFALLLLMCTAFALFDYHRVSQIYLQPEERSSWYANDALGAARKSVLFKSHAKFAELVITSMSRENAPRILALSSELIEWSPEPRVIEKLIESATMMQLDDLAVFHLRRYKVAYPQAYALWSQRNM